MKSGGLHGCSVVLGRHAEALAGKLRRNSGVELTGLLRPKSVLAKSEPASTDPVEHAEDFALRYFEPLENFRLML
jgi:hypothetical protein